MIKFVASKCGWEVFGPTRSVSNSPDHIQTYIEGTIERLGFVLDLYHLPRLDPKTPLEKSIAALDGIRKAGKCKYIGLSAIRTTLYHALPHVPSDSGALVSSTNPSQCQLYRPYRCVQAEYSAFETVHKSESDGLITTAHELNIAFVDFSPLYHGWLVDNFDYSSADDFALDDFRRIVPKFQGESFPKNKVIVMEMKELTGTEGCTISQLDLAWVVSQGLIPIVGTTKAGRLVENRGYRAVTFDEEELKEMRRIVEEAKPEGERLNEMMKGMVGH